ATGERDMEHLGGLVHRMPLTAFAFLIGSAAISALPPFNGFVSEWLTFQAILLSPALPQWLLKFLVPAIGALLALSAALAAACFVKAFGITFLGRARTQVARDAVGAEVIHRWASNATRRSAPWDCGFPDASPVTQYTAGSFSQPIRKVFGTVVFRAREEVDLPVPGDSRAARLRVRLRDVLWDVLYMPTGAVVTFAAGWLNKVQFMTIRGYLTLVFSALVVLLTVLAA